MQELRDWLATENVDVCLIQETELAKKDAIPPFLGYNLVNEGIIFQRATEGLQPTSGKTHHTYPAIPPYMGDDSQSLRGDSERNNLNRPFARNNICPFMLAAGDL